MRFPRALSLVLASSLLALAADAPPPGKARIRIHVPASAQVVIGEKTFRQTGAERVFLTPTLAEGETYPYKITATWIQKGKRRKAIRKLSVKAGDDLVVDFLLATVPSLREPIKP